MKISFIGLGIMGSRMAANLLKNNIQLTVYNRTQKAAEELAELGAQVATSIEEAVKDADIVFSMLSTPEVVEKFFIKEGAALSKMKPNAIWIDCSTVNPSFSEYAGKKANEKGIRFMDAPVAGSKPQAEAAALAFFVGAEPALLEEVKYLFEKMGSKVLNIGETGKGSSFKMLVNMMLAQSMVIFSESVLLGEKMGISRDFLLNAIPNLPVSAPFTKAKAEMVKDSNYEVQFPLEWMHKDLHLAEVTAKELDQPLYLASLAKTLYKEATDKGMGRLDFSAIHKYLNKHK